MTKVDQTSLERFLGLLEGHNSNLKDLLLAKAEPEFIGATEGAIERAMKTIENGSKGVRDAEPSLGCRISSRIA
ncbi:MAG: hypothetical protein IPI43_23290 [Sandaracinaceae bacterium]|nr:hypothetical protein [Sandaracinaceae bacterium]